MIYPDSFEHKTGFDQIRRLLYEKCASTLGSGCLEKMQFSVSFAEVNELLEQTEEFRQIIITHESFPISGIFDPLLIFDRLKIEGAFAEAADLHEMRTSIITINSILKFLRQKKTGDAQKYPALCTMAEGIIIDPDIISQTDKIIDEKGGVRSGASAKLAELRRETARLESQALRKILQIFSQAKNEGWIENNSELALRNGRQVIPVAAAYKRKIKGFVHDQSTTGQTVYIEPESVFEANNQLRQLELDERKEIVKILTLFANFLRPHLSDLTNAFRFLGKIDFTRAKAMLAIELQAQKPILYPKPHLNWIKALHPLLYLSYKSQNRKVEPLSIELKSPRRIMVISGPNAGGKSVCLKTAGLVQYMLQCGLLVPMDANSEAGIFKEIFIDIGDQQSIENDLSTYSSHLSNMQYFLKNCGTDSLFLIDEFGAGTEPRIGGAIAEAILKELALKQSYGIVTTHYSNLKVLADTDPAIINGSMLFDTQNMKPLFKLKSGTPGSSFAFEIAKTMGLSDKILKTAENIAGTDHLKFDRQLHDLEMKKTELDEKEKALRSGDTFLAELIDKYEALNTDLSNRRNELIAQAKSEAKAILADTNRIIEKTIREIRESSAEKNKTKMLRENISQFSHQISDNPQQNEKATPPVKKKKNRPSQENLPDVVPGQVIEGDYVRIKGQDTVGQVLKANPRDVVVVFGEMQMKISVQKLEKLNSKKFANSEKASYVRYDFDINEKAVTFSPYLDIRGQKVQEALPDVRKFMDDAILLGAKNLKILHGTGNGILREAVRSYLRTISEIKSITDEHPDRGGQGCTLIAL